MLPCFGDPSLSNKFGKGVHKEAMPSLVYLSEASWINIDLQRQ